LITGLLAIVSVSVAVPVPLLLETLRLILNVPAAVGVPEIKPVAALKLKPGGIGVAVYPLGIAWLAVICYEYGTPVFPQSVVRLVMLGFAASTLPAAANTTRNGRSFLTG